MNKARKSSILIIISLINLYITSCSIAQTIDSRVTISTPSTPAIAERFKNIEERCMRASPNSFSNLPGILVLGTGTDIDLHETLLNLNSGMLTDLGAASSAKVSPSGNLLSYWDYENNQYLIFNASGNLVKSIPYSSEIMYQDGWLDDLNLLFWEPAGDATNWSMGVWNIDTTDHLQINSFDLPDLDDLDEWPQWDTKFILNSDLRSLVYPSKEEGNPAILWDIEDEVEITRIYNTDRSVTPSWSPIGQRFVISAKRQAIDENNGATYKGGYDLYLVSVSGEVERLTFYGTQQPSYQQALSWSPDGGRIAYLVGENQNYLPYFGELSVVDMETGEIVKYCTQGGISSSLTWSPDGNYLGFHGLNDFPTYLVNLKSGEYWTLDDLNISDYKLDGWMAAFEN